uniref:Uncharacterized protein n=1 Tax=Heterorhabditis bacteriophora TaxID=37862 RepID=A0A1I7WKL5_HETBA
MNRLAYGFSSKLHLHACRIIYIYINFIISEYNICFRWLWQHFSTCSIYYYAKFR